MKLKNLELVVKNTSIQYDGREKLIDNFLEESTKKTHSSPDSFEELLFKYFSLFQDEKERLITILLDSKKKIIGIDLVSVGTLNASLVHPREVFRKAILAGADSIIIAHNHPSNNTEPSPADIKVAITLHFTDFSNPQEIANFLYYLLGYEFITENEKFSEIINEYRNDKATDKVNKMLIDALK